MRASETARHHQRFEREAVRREIDAVLRVWSVLGAFLQQAQDEIGLIEEPERRQARALGGGPHAREVHVRRDVLFAGTRQPGRRAGASGVRGRAWIGVWSRHVVAGKRGQRAGRVAGRVQVARLMSVIDEDDEAAP